MRANPLTMPKLSTALSSSMRPRPWWTNRRPKRWAETARSAVISVSPTHTLPPGSGKPEFNDSFYYTVFPNFHPWGAFNAITYRFRPNGDDHESCIMECMAALPRRTATAGGQDQLARSRDQWAAHAPELGGLARVFDQDTFNLPRVQQGLRAMKKPGVTLANYQELKVRHIHVLLDEWISRD